MYRMNGVETALLHSIDAHGKKQTVKKVYDRA